MKRVLLIGPMFANAGHGAECGIFDALCELGCDVTCWDPRQDKGCSWAPGFDEAAQYEVDPEVDARRGGGEEFDLILCPGPGLPDKVLESKLFLTTKGPRVLWNSEPIRLAQYR